MTCLMIMLACLVCSGMIWQMLQKPGLVIWRFVLLELSVLRAEILSNGIGAEMAEIAALLVEAAELVRESEQKNPNYYRYVES